MLFLIDYENVGNSGMRGCHYLNMSDDVIVFYSETRKNMERRFLEDITNSGCSFDICKLCKNGKNALDFYIASRLGELFGSGYEGTAIIVSNDSGFQTVREYWDKKALHKKRVLVSACVEDGIISSNENSSRARELRKLRENLSIGEYFEDYMEKVRLKTIIQNLFAGTEFENMTEQIQNLMEQKEKTPKLIYLNCLHSFGREGGLAIYNRMKACEDL